MSETSPDEASPPPITLPLALPPSMTLLTSSKATGASSTILMFRSSLLL
ncbi:hypothetical protein [Vreelandella alkaliphila]